VGLFLRRRLSPPVGAPLDMLLLSFQIDEPFLAKRISPSAPHSSATHLPPSLGDRLPDKVMVFFGLRVIP